MAKQDVLVIGGGISGLTFAWEAARAGRSAAVVEREDRVGGAICSRRAPEGYWYELGAHTCYNSYVGLAEMVEACGARGAVRARAKTHLRFMDGDTVLPGSNMGALLRRFDLLEAARSFPRILGAKKDGETVYSYYSRIVGRKNYGNVLGPMLSAVPSQNADAFPADMLFKARKTRRQDFPRSFTLDGGLQALCEAVARQQNVTVLPGRAASRVERAGAGFAVTLDGGERHEAAVLAIAVPPSAAAGLLGGVAPELARQLARVKESTVESLGVVVETARTAHIPTSMFIVPRDDAFHSIVTRDSVPDARFRSFAFHFKPGHSRDAKLARAAAFLGVPPAEFADVSERHTVLPSPVLGHEDVVREIDRLSAGAPLAVTGNYFAGLSLEDCVARSREEWARIAKLATVA